MVIASLHRNICLYSEYNDGLYDVVIFLLRFIRQLRKIYLC